MFSEFAAIPDNVVLLTGRSEMGTLGRQLFDIWNDRQRPETKWDKGKIGSNVMMEGSLTLKVAKLKDMHLFHANYHSTSSILEWLCKALS